jgi:hypothetical protein
MPTQTTAPAAAVRVSTGVAFAAEQLDVSAESLGGRP